MFHLLSNLLQRKREESTSLMSTDQDLVNAKIKIDHIPYEGLLDDPDLYAPVFRNVSLFKRLILLMHLDILINKLWILARICHQLSNYNLYH